MSRLNLNELSPAPSGQAIERLEVLRSRLRLAKSLGEIEIQEVLRQMDTLRADLLLARKVTPEAMPTQPRQRTTYADLGFEGVLGESQGILEALELVRRAAPTTLPMLIDGESGTGKELFARVVHANSERSEQPFVSVNCGAIPENLIESELFGHRKGAFTGATSDRRGRFEAADGGTIFLDEVGELPMQGQVKLLRVLQANEVQRVGADNPISVDTRVVAATNRNLAEMAAEGSFREDLYYRLSVIEINLPPLRERRDEIELLCDYFLNQAAEELDRPTLQLNQAIQSALQTYQFPGNIRELRNLIFRLSCLADEVAGLDHLPAAMRDALASNSHNHTEIDRDTAPDTDGQTLADVRRSAGDHAERQFLEQGLKDTAGRVVDLAKQLEMNRSYLQTLLKKHGLKSKDYRPNARAS